ncbi:MAG: hypothetical protein K2M79_02835 [Muribaculaceae bacterium]|nr:hypothetical protein [Muribaculaceae bacterium]
MYENLTNPISRLAPNNDNRLCKDKLAADLAVLGVQIQADEFIDAMAAGSTTLIEGSVLAIELVTIWLEYEACNGRFH